jgi:hypothetical protein
MAARLIDHAASMPYTGRGLALHCKNNTSSSVKPIVLPD